MLGISACHFASRLQVFSETVSSVCTGKSTFTRLESMLEDALTDDVSPGDPDVVVDIEAIALAGYVLSDLQLSVTLTWDIGESFTLKSNLGQILDAAGVDDSNYDTFFRSLIPFDGSATANVSGKLYFTLYLGLEYNSDTKRARPYIMGTTGITLLWSSQGILEFGASLGQIDAKVNTTFCFGASADLGNCDATGIQHAELKIAFDEATNYYLTTEPLASTRPRYQYFSSLSGLIDQANFSFTGGPEAKLTVTIASLLGKAIIVVSVKDINALVLSAPNAIEVSTELPSAQKILSLSLSFC
jgi:hypothetical protein